jgi:peptidoglycan/xylan/chitin deacetylase (PgdA/CDA1 family)
MTGMLDVFFTVDVEVWCDGWNDIDAQFPRAFDQYVYGRTVRGDFGLPYTLDVLDSHGLSGIFFVEPLFAMRFGDAPLAEIVGLLDERKHEVQLHLHPEWVDEARESPIRHVSGKRRYMKQFSLNEQKVLIAEGLKLLNRTGAAPVNAFRAGSWGFNTDTLFALADNGIPFDSSYNPRTLGTESGLHPGVPLVEPLQFAGVFEYPVTAFRDGTRKLRPVQLTACSYREVEGLLWQALEKRRTSFVIVSHNFELLNEAKSGADAVVVRRLQQLCRFLDRHRDCFRTRGFRDLRGSDIPTQPSPLRSPLWKTGQRIVQQALRRRYA